MAKYIGEFFLSVIGSNLQQIRYKGWAVTSLLIIKFLGCQLVVKKPYIPYENTEVDTYIAAAYC